MFDGDDDSDEDDNADDGDDDDDEHGDDKDDDGDDDRNDHGGNDDDEADDDGDDEKSAVAKRLAKNLVRQLKLIKQQEDQYEGLNKHASAMAQLQSANMHTFSQRSLPVDQPVREVRSAATPSTFVGAQKKKYKRDPNLITGNAERCVGSPFFARC